MNEEQISKIVENVIKNNASKNLFDRHKMEKVIDAAVARANELGVGVTIAIMKADQVLQMSYHMPNANLVSCTLAPKKAWSALAMKEPTKDISKDIQPGAGLYQMETMLDGKLASFAGGIPLKINDEIIGAIGVSGGLVEEDQSICEAAVDMQINDIESAVRKILAEELDNASSSSANVAATTDNGHRGIFTNVNDAIAAAKAAQEIYRDKPIAVRQQVIDAIKEGFRPYIEKMAKDIKEETGMGTVEAKIAKLNNALYNTPGPEILEPVVENGDGGMVMYERLPYGVIGAVGPSTNPSETVIANAIMMLAGGNTLYFGAHPGAKNVTRWTIEKMNDFIADATGLHNLVVSIETPTIESVQQMMKHPDIAMLAVTGGPAVVHQAMTSGKKAVGAGPGNPPAMVDATADIDLAAHNIITSASFDNDILCTAEKEVVAASSIKDELIRKMQDEGAFVVNREQKPIN